MSAAREKLLITALDLFLHEGLQTVGIDRVIKLSGISKMTLYKYFPSKDHLIAECLQHYHSEIVSEIQQCIVSSPPMLEQKLVILLAWYRRKFVETPILGCIFVSAANLYTDIEHPVHQVCLLHKHMLIDMIAQLLDGFGYANPQELAMQCLILFEGARNLYTIGVQGDSLESATRVLLLLLQQHRPQHPSSSSPAPGEV